ncbi:MAG: hypothetical protein L0I24_00340 [Pseudonocardia sp.]|nr:hypothetical protein [Pseudonocardia sp.]
MTDIERYDRPVQAMFTGTDRAMLRYEATRRGLTISALLRMVAIEWLAEHAAAPDLRAVAARRAEFEQIAACPVQPLTGAVPEFVTHRCRLDPDATVACSDLYDAWAEWRAPLGQAGSRQVFSTRLRAVAPHIAVYRTSAGGRAQPRRYRGIELTTTQESA